jgi:hypothetical protein
MVKRIFNYTSKPVLIHLLQHKVFTCAYLLMLIERKEQGAFKITVLRVGATGKYDGT